MRRIQNALRTLTVSAEAILPCVFLGMLLSLAGCASSGVDGELLVDSPPPLRSVVIDVQGGRSERGLNQKDLDALVPLLKVRVPKVFALNDVAATLPPGSPDASMVLTLTPVKAGRSGARHYLDFAATLYSRERQKMIWRGSLDIGYSGSLSQFDEQAADQMAVRLLEQLRTDKIYRGGSVRRPG
ncbi:MAG: hypothetical protein QM776_17670 [Rhodocyclaceae bacterium]